MLCHQVTYRVVQVTDDQLEASADGTGAVSVVSTAAFAGTPQAVAQVSKQTVGRRQMCEGVGGVEVLWEMRLISKPIPAPQSGENTLSYLSSARPPVVSVYKRHTTLPAFTAVCASAVAPLSVGKKQQQQQQPNTMEINFSHFYCPVYMEKTFFYFYF